LEQLEKVEKAIERAGPGFGNHRRHTVEKRTLGESSMEGVTRGKKEKCVFGGAMHVGSYNSKKVNHCPESRENENVGGKETKRGCGE